MEKREKLEKAIHYIINHYYHKMSAEDAASASGLTTRELSALLSKYCGVPFVKFLRKYRLRQAAKEIPFGYVSLDTIGLRNGFQSKKFFAEFKKEFGVTPKQLLGCAAVPDMPLPAEMNKHAFRLEYKTVEDVTIEGYPIKTVEECNSHLMENVAYAFRNPDSHVDLHSKEKLWGVWWHDSSRDKHLCYLAGPEADCSKEIKEGYIRIKITGGKYAVFSAERGRDYFDIAKTAGDMAWYAFKIWEKINGKQTDKMGFTYEIFDSKKIYLYIPLLRGFGGIEIEREVGGNSIEKVVQYIDEHILEEMDADKVASHFGRSDIYYRDRFQACYKVSMPDYIQKKRLYILAQKLDDQEITEKNIMEDFHFESISRFRKDFIRLFKTGPENYRSVALHLINLKEYYSDNFKYIKMTKEWKTEQRFFVMPVKSGANKTELDLDIPGIASFWMRNRDFPGNNKKIALYETDAMSTADKIIYNFVLGSVKKEGEAPPEGFHEIVVEGGKYMVFESTEKEPQEENLAETMRMIIRCIDHVWVYDNWIQTDFRTRVSFWYYEDGKIRYCVPIYG